MAIDYAVRVRCEPQQTLGVERLIDLNRTRILARSMIAHMEEEGEIRAPSEVEIQLTMRKPDGDSAKGVTLQDLLDQTQPLERVTHACAKCPAGFTRELACHRRIRYPIPEHVEEWLMGRLPKNLQCTAGALLARGLAEMQWDGEPANRLRASGTSFFESRAPYGIRWEGESGTLEVSSDQLFQMMFMVGTIEPTHALMLVLFTGVIPHDTSLHDLKDRPGRERVLAAADLPPQPDPDIEQLAAFLRMLAIAARMEATVVVDG